MFGEVVLVGRLREANRRLNPAIPEEAREEALRKVLRVGTPALTHTRAEFALGLVTPLRQRVIWLRLSPKSRVARAKSPRSMPSRSNRQRTPLRWHPRFSMRQQFAQREPGLAPTRRMAW